MQHKYQWLVFPSVLLFVAVALGVLYLLSTPDKNDLGIRRNSVDKKSLDRPRSNKAKSPTIAGAFVGTILGAPALTVDRSTYHYGNSYRHSYSGSVVYVFESHVTNHSRKAVDEVLLYVRCKDPSRTVPLTESIEQVEVDGGIEPGETKIVRCEVLASSFSSQQDEPIEVGVVDEYPPLYVKPYKHYKNPNMVVSDYVAREDPAMKLLGL